MARDAGLTIRRLPELGRGRRCVHARSGRRAGQGPVHDHARRRDRAGPVALNFEGLSPAELAKLDPKVPSTGVGLAVAGRLTADLDREQGAVADRLRAAGRERRDRAARRFAAPLPIDPVSLRGGWPPTCWGPRSPKPRSSPRAPPSRARPSSSGPTRKITLRAKVTAANVAAPDLRTLLAAQGSAGRRAIG